MKQLLVLLGIVTAFAFSSCTKKASDAIVGNWILSHVNYYYYDSQQENFQQDMIWEFGADGTLRFETPEGVAEGSYSVDGSNITLRYGKNDTQYYYDGTITNMEDNRMSWSLNSIHMDFSRTNLSVGDSDSEFYFVSAESEPSYGGEVTGTGYYHYGSSCTLRAIANFGFVFVNWTEDGQVVSAESTYLFTVYSDRHLVANFEPVYTPSPYIQFEWDGHVFYNGETITCTNDENGSGDLVQHIQVRNRTDETKCFVIEKEDIQGLDGVTNSISSNRVCVSAQSVNDEDLSFHAIYEDQVYGMVIVEYYVYEENHPDERISLTVRYNRFSGDIPEGATISVTGDCWFVLDHQYSDGETIHLENATFGLYGAADDGGHQQLISGGEEGTGEQLRIGQAGLIWTDYSFVYFNMIEMIQMDEYGYGHATSLSDGYILNNADVVFSPSNIYINGELVASYTTRHLDLNTNMCLFANNESGWDVVRNQTATLGTVTITNAYGNVTAKYNPMLDGNGTPCFYNSVSGAFIYHSGSGTPIFTRGANGY